MEYENAVDDLSFFMGIAAANAQTVAETVGTHPDVASIKRATTKVFHDLGNIFDIHHVILSRLGIPSNARQAQDAAAFRESLRTTLASLREVAEYYRFLDQSAREAREVQRALPRSLRVSYAPASRFPRLNHVQMNHHRR